jgi:hypothetical protein
MQTTKVRRSNIPLLVIVFLVMAHPPTSAQTTSTGNIKTTGTCSPVVIQPKGGFTITCKDASLTPAESEKQARQISELLTRLKASSANYDQLEKSLDTIINDLDEIKANALPRHLTIDQRNVIRTALVPYPKAKIDLYINMGDAESAQYAMEFVSIFKEVHILDSNVTGGYGSAMYTPPIKGFSLYLSPDDFKQKKITPECGALAGAIYGNVQQTKMQLGSSVMVRNGTCQLLIGVRGVP